VDCGLRPNSSEISLPAPTNFPFGDDQVTSAIFVVLTLFMVEWPNSILIRLDVCIHLELVAAWVEE
jgi:hypothetical protein